MALEEIPESASLLGPECGADLHVVGDADSDSGDEVAPLPLIDEDPRVTAARVRLLDECRHAIREAARYLRRIKTVLNETELCRSEVWSVSRRREDIARWLARSLSDAADQDERLTEELGVQDPARYGQPVPSMEAAPDHTLN
jgi:hypothetical protein